MRGGPTPAWTFIIVPPTTIASTRRVGVRMRTVRRALMLACLVIAPVLVLSWSWLDTQATTTEMLADRVAAQERVMRLLTDSLNAYLSEAVAERVSRSPPANMIMPLAGRVTSWFSRARLHPILRIRREHRGIDVAAAAGTRIVAPAQTTVAYVGRRFGFGLTVELVHRGGVVTRYAHCRAILVKTGDQVAMGQGIATVGSTGLATGPHLHFEVLFKGTAVDPVQFLAGTRTSPPLLNGAQGTEKASPANDEE
ncbi:MAG: M23 family metallopeptidase [Gemmatimonas sp.]